MEEKFEYIEKTKKQLRNWFNSKKREKIKFENFDNFYSWYKEQDKVCYYCGLSEKDSQKIVKTGLLKSNRFPENGIISSGRARGMWLEIDRKDPNKKYSEDNCVLACYFCNNDKSDVFDAKQYKKYLKDRSKFFKDILNNDTNS